MTSHQESKEASAAPPAGQDRPKPKHITNPRRLLILSPTTHAQNTIPALLHSLTGVPVSAPPQVTTATPAGADAAADNNADNADADTNKLPFTTSFAGYTTHAPLRIQTKYYTADVPIWVDEIPLSSSSSSSNNGDDGDDGGAQQNPSATPAQWKTEFLSAEARVVRDAIGAIVICVQNLDAPSSAVPKEAYASSTASAAAAATPASERADVRALKDLIQMIADVKSQTEEERGENGDVPGLLVLVGEKKTGTKQRKKQQEEEAEDGELIKDDEEVFGATWWEDELYDMGVFGFEVVAWDPKTDNKKDEEKRNKFGEYEGMRRIREVLETHDWAVSKDKDKDNDNDLDNFLHSEDEHDDHEDGFKLEVDELEREMMGLRFAIQNGGRDNDDDDDDDEHNEHDAELKVEELEALMMRMRAIKDMSADLPESQRKAFASKAVRDLMREL
ncbi:hypothetical protein VTN77DRAFT_9462 [Rasamsonia byssochlamydoides]|uniref:uncharacterized protein n=1 Tax=Rasamsonia byssochlamydoides TaxID=89139 RepID=UPI0037433455